MNECRIGRRMRRQKINEFKEIWNYWKTKKEPNIVKEGRGGKKQNEILKLEKVRRMENERKASVKGECGGRSWRIGKGMGWGRGGGRAQMMEGRKSLKCLSIHQTTISVSVVLKAQQGGGQQGIAELGRLPSALDIQDIQLKCMFSNQDQIMAEANSDIRFYLLLYTRCSRSIARSIDRPHLISLTQENMCMSHFWRCNFPMNSPYVRLSRRLDGRSFIKVYKLSKTNT